MFICRELLSVVQQVDSVAVDAFEAFLVFGEILHHLELLRQIHDGDVDIIVEIDAAKSPTACVSAHIEQGLRLIAEHNLQSLVERVVRVKMVESEPALLHLFRQL